MHKLEDFLKPFKYLAIARPEDNEEILKLLATVPMDSEGFNLRYDRSPDFFKLLKEQAKESIAIKILNKDGTIGGIGVYTLRHAYENGEKCMIGYTSDLRVSPTISMRSRVAWRNGYAAIMKEYKSIAEFSHVKYFYTAILDDNQNAIRALTKGNTGFNYIKISSYRSINVYGQSPFKKYKPHLKTIETHIKSEEVIDFLQTCNQVESAGQFYHVNDVDSEHTRRLSSIESYNFSHYLVVKNAQGSIIACCYPFSTTDSRRLIVEKMDVKHKVLSMLSPLVGGKKLIEGQGLRMLYLTDLTFAQSLTEQEEADCITAFLQHLFKSKRNKDYHLTTLIDYHNNLLDKSLNTCGFFYEEKKASLYQVSHEEHDPKQGHYTVPPQKKISFELALS